MKDLQPQKQINLLILEDSSYDREVLQKTLRAGELRDSQWDFAGSLKEGRKLWMEKTYDVVLTDLSLVDSKGLETVRRVLDFCKQSPVLVLSSVNSNNVALDSMAIGAQDFISKMDLHNPNIAHKIILAIERFRLVAEVTMQNRKLQKHNAFKDRFFNFMSHELRTPLNGITGNLSLLETTSLTEEQQDLVSSLRTSSKTLLSVVEDILELARMESGTFVITSSPTRVEAIAESVCQALKPLLQHKPGAGVELCLKVESSFPKWVRSDPKRLHQVLLNLVANAIKFTEQGEIQVLIEAGKKEHHLYVQVKDTGAGIAAEKLETLFEEFSQAHEQDQQNGSGLGLAICRQIINAMDGEIGVSSTLGKGSRFWFNVPYIPTSQEEAERQAQASHTAETALNHDLLLPANSGRWVLVIDDVRENLTIAKKMLVKLGFQVQVAQSGAEAESCAQSQEFDVVFVDLQMPVQNGMETFERLKAQKLLKADCQVIALTASAAQDQRNACLAAGMSGFLSKPISIPKLIGALAGAKDQRLQGAQDAQTPLEAQHGPLVNPSKVAELRSLSAPGEDFFAEMVETFLQDTPRTLHALWSAIAAKDGRSMHAEAHRLAGYCRNIGADALARLCERIEDDEGAKTTQGYGTSEEEFHKVYEETCRLLQKKSA